jgi:hydroxymethylglutaryl-CoA lyase
MGEHVRMHEVGPRDGLQNEARVIPLAEKIALVDAVLAAGLRDVEIGSFVSPRWVPQMADTAEVMAGVDVSRGARFSVLVPNIKGFRAFVQARAGLRGAPCDVAVFVAATERFSRANLNCTVDESIDRAGLVVEAAKGLGVGVRGYVSCVTDCPFDGPVSPGQVARVVERLWALGPMQVSLGDTIGSGRSNTVAAMLGEVLNVAPAPMLAGHFHDTGGFALENIEVALGLGLRAFDAAVGGLGGCPYAPGAPGNVATETVVARLEALGYETGVDLALLKRAATLAQGMRGP